MVDVRERAVGVDPYRAIHSRGAKHIQYISNAHQKAQYSVGNWEEKILVLYPEHVFLERDYSARVVLYGERDVWVRLEYVRINMVSDCVLWETVIMFT